MPFDYVKCSERLRELRQERKESHQTLANCFGEDETGKNAITKQTLMNYEQAAKNGGGPTGKESDKTKSICGMSIKTLVMLANHFGVSTDYLLGLSDCRSVDPDIASAIKTTGLDEKSIAVLHSMTEHDILGGAAKYKPGVYQRGLLDAINMLLPSKTGRALLLDVFSYAIAEYDKFSCEVDGKTFEIDSVFLNSGGEPIWELVAKSMNESMIANIQADLHDLKKEIIDSKSI